MTSPISSSLASYATQATSGASMKAPPSQRMAALFDKIDSGNTGSITKAQFEDAFQNMNPPARIKAMGADAVYSQLDPSGSGSISKQDFVSGMKNVLAQARGGHHGHHEHGDSATSTGSITGDSSAAAPVTDLASSIASLQSLIASNANNGDAPPPAGSLIKTSA
jgi:hypothetical protein